MADLFNDMDTVAQQSGGFVQPDPLTDFKVRQAQIDRRRKLADELVSKAFNAPAGQMVGRIYVANSPWSNFAQSFAGSAMGAQADKADAELALQQRMAQSDWSKRYNTAPDDATRQQLIVEARNRGLRYDLENAFRKEEADRIERGEQLAATRVEAANEKEANRAFLASQGELNRQNRLDVRSMPTIHISQGNGGKAKPPMGYEWNGDELQPIKGGPKDPNAAPVKPVNLTAAQQKAVDDSDALLGYIDSALEGVKTNPNAIGFKTVIPDMALSKIDPEGVATRAAVAGLSAERVHQLSGAAVSPAEFARLRPYLPASGDTADAVQKKLTNLRAEVERIRTSHMKGPTRAQPQQSGKPTVVRTGVLNGRKVEQLSDGTTRYAD